MGLFDGGGGGGIGGAISGAASGAGLGGALGATALGPVGMLGGAVLGSGALNGVPGLGPLAAAIGGGGQNAGWLGVGQFQGNPYDINQQSFQNDPLKAQQDAMRQAAAARAKIQGPQLNMSPQDQFRAQQLQLTNALQAQAAGQGPSMAQSQLRQATDRNLAQQMGLAASMRGGNPALAQRQAAMNAANIQQQAAGQAADTRTQEMLNAQSQLAGALGGARGQDISAAQSNLAAGLQSQAQKDQMAQFYQGQQNQAAGTIGQGQQDLERLQVQQNLGMQGLNEKGYENASNARGAAVGGLGQGIMDKLPDLAPLLAASTGMMVPGKPEVAGDSPKNDKVPIVASPGEIVLPRSIIHDDKKILSFVRALRGKVQKFEGGGVVQGGPNIDVDKGAATSQAFMGSNASAADRLASIFSAVTGGK